MTTSDMFPEGRPKRLYGTVRWFNEAQGVGVIRGDDGRDVKAHYTAIRGEGYRSLETGERVEFEVSGGLCSAEARDIVSLQNLVP